MGRLREGLVMSAVLASALTMALTLAAGPLAAQEKSGDESTGKQAQAQQATRVFGDAVRTEPLAQTAPVLGRLIPEQSGVVAARIGGPVATVSVQVGDRVKEGQVLAVLVSDTLEWQRELRAAEVAQAEAALRTTRAQVDILSQELARLEQLRRSAAFSQARFDDKRLEVAKAKSAIGETEAALVRARSSLRLAEIALRDSRVRAPFDGVVTERHTDAGAYLGAGSPVVTLVNDRALEIEADVPGSRVGGLTPGAVVEVDLAGEGQAKASVRAVVPQENPLTRTRAVRFTPVFDTGQELAVNQSVTVHVPIGARRDVVTVHKDAVLNRKGSTIVFLVDDGQAKVQPVQLGDAVGQRFEVLSGLHVGDMVVVRGNERLRPGETVQLAEAGGR